MLATRAHATCNVRAIPVVHQQMLRDFGLKQPLSLQLLLQLLPRRSWMSMRTAAVETCM
jgi:hypothetical protein